MKNKISKAQLEVWEVKEKLYLKLKNIPTGKRVAFLQKKAIRAMKIYFSNKTVALQT